MVIVMPAYNAARTLERTYADIPHDAIAVRLELDQPAYGVAAGQAAVLYDGDVVVGCGVVSDARDA